MGESGRQCIVSAGKSVRFLKPGEKAAKCVQVLCSREEGAPLRALLWNTVKLPIIIAIFCFIV